MEPFVDQIITTLDREPDPVAIHHALLNAAFLFEKAHGLSPSAWPVEVQEANPTPDDVTRLKRAVVAHVQRTGFGSWALGKCFDPTLKPILVATLQRHLDGDPGELFQAMIALDNIGEPVFANSPSRSILDEQANREVARTYLSGH